VDNPDAIGESDEAANSPVILVALNVSDPIMKEAVISENVQSGLMVPEGTHRY